MAEKVRRVQFAVPSEYERQRAEAERRRLMAEMLAQQEYDPGQFPGAPIPKAAPLVQGLQSFLKAYSVRKAKEAEEGARTADVESARELLKKLGPQERVAAPDVFADPESMPSKYAAPRMETYTPSEEERQNLLLESAVGGSPRAAQLAQLLMSQKPETKTMEFGGQLVNVTGGTATPVTMGGQPLAAPAKPKTLEKTVDLGTVVEYHYSDGSRETVAKRQGPAKPKDERIVSIIGSDGKAIYVPESQAIGKTPFTPKTYEQQRDEDRQKAKDAQSTINTNTVLEGISELITHPGRKSATGASSFMSNVPGTAARGFKAKLDTFKAQTFVPMVEALKGMGALSDAEGKRLTDSVGALDVAMPEKEFEQELRRVANYLYSKAVAAGLQVQLPETIAPAQTPKKSRSNW